MVDRQITPGYLKMNIRGTGACDRSASGSGRSMDPLEKQMTSAQDNNKRLREIYRFPIDRFLKKTIFLFIRFLSFYAGVICFSSGSMDRPLPEAERSQAPVPRICILRYLGLV